MSLLGCVQSLALLDVFVSAIKGMWSQLRKSVDDITLGAITNILKNRIRTENYHVKSKEWSGRKKYAKCKVRHRSRNLKPMYKVGGKKEDVCKVQSMEVS